MNYKSGQNFNYNIKIRMQYISPLNANEWSKLDIKLKNLSKHSNSGSHKTSNHLNFFSINTIHISVTICCIKVTESLRVLSTLYVDWNVPARRGRNKAWSGGWDFSSCRASTLRDKSRPQSIMPWESFICHLHLQAAEKNESNTDVLALQ